MVVNAVTLTRSRGQVSGHACAGIFRLVWLSPRTKLERGGLKVQHPPLCFLARYRVTGCLMLFSWEFLTVAGGTLKL